MNAVIEIGVIGKIVYADPLEWRASAEARTHGLEIWTISPDLLVTVHADVRRWHSRGGGSLDRRMTVTTIDTVIANVMFMTELNWLLPFDPLAGVPGRTIQLNGDVEQGDDDKNCAVDRNLR